MPGQTSLVRGTTSLEWASDCSLDVVEAGAGRPVFAVRPPREEQKTAADDDDRCAETHPVPDAVEDHDAEHAQQKYRDQCPGVLGVQAHRRGVYERHWRRRKHW
jgi:hypothetical protein